MGAPVLCGCHWLTGIWSGSNGWPSRPQKFETCPVWGAKFFIDIQAPKSQRKTRFCKTVGTFVGMLQYRGDCLAKLRGKWPTHSCRSGRTLEEMSVRLSDTGAKKTSIYLVCFHSTNPESLDRANGQFLIVETAIRNGEWPYDNGDDPSFYVARKGGRLTWGVCRQDLPNQIERDSIVVFFSFTHLKNNETLYRLCARDLRDALRRYPRRATPRQPVGRGTPAWELMAPGPVAGR